MTSYNINHYYFLASPYNGSVEERKYRYQKSQDIVAYFLRYNISIFAPILYNETIIKSFSSINFEHRRELLMPMNINFLHRSAGVLILKIEGWDKSWGMKQYIEVCNNNDMPLYELNPENLEETLCALQAAMS